MGGCTSSAEESFLIKTSIVSDKTGPKAKTPTQWDWSRADTILDRSALPINLWHCADRLFYLISGEGQPHGAHVQKKEEEKNGSTNGRSTSSVAASTASEIIEVLKQIAHAPPSDLIKHYGLLDTILCLLGRNEFDKDLPTTDVAGNQRNADISFHALHCLYTLSSAAIDSSKKNEHGKVEDDTAKAEEAVEYGHAVLEWLIAHKWAALDIVLFYARGDDIDAEAKALLEMMYSRSAAGKAAVKVALETEFRARRVYVTSGAKADDLPPPPAQHAKAAAAEAAMTEARKHYGCQVEDGPAESESAADFEAEVKRLTRAAMCVWQSVPWKVFPSSFRARGKSEQKAAHKRLQKIVEEIKVLAPCERKQLNRQLTEIVMDVPPEFVSEMVSGGIFTESKVYSQVANSHHPGLPESDEYQAGRNVWACFGLQLILLRGVPVECNDAVLGYSMLYPFSDNLLDSPNMDMSAKKLFQKAFRAWLRGGEVPAELMPRTVVEHKVHDQVQLIAKKWPRETNPNVFHSLVAINDAQTRSLELHCDPLDAKYEDALEVSCYKGGTSVLADLFVTAGNNPLRAEAAYAFHLGFALQIVDDLQDVAEDLEAGQQTLFTVPKALDGLFADAGAVRLAHIIHAVLDRPLQPGDMCTRRILQDGKRQMCYTMTLKAVMRAQTMFTNNFLAQAETFCPIPREGMAKLAGMRTLMRLVKEDSI